jgi:hypothetical protein|tara:strand:- start:51 stop:590 length:540 start_codon:yes stop_codon:yes gene_type:complete
MKKQKRYNYNQGGLNVSKTVAENEMASAAVGANLSIESGLNLNAKAAIKAAEKARLEANVSKNVTTGNKTSRIGVSAQQQIGPFNIQRTESIGTGGRGSTTSVGFKNATYKRNNQNGSVINSLGAGWKGFNVGVDRSDAGTGGSASYNKTLKGGGNVNANLNKVPGSKLSGSITYRKTF